MHKKIYVLLSFVYLGCQSGPKTVSHSGYALGTTYNIQYAPLEADYERVQKGVDSLFFDINKSLSTYLPESDISKINRGDTALVVDHHFKAVFHKANIVWHKSDGYFDPTVGAWVNAYGFGPDKPLKTISAKQRDSLMNITGWAKLSIDKSSRVIKRHPSIYIDFNAIAKGYTVDVIANYLKSLGSQNHLVEIGGEIVALGHSPKTNAAWKIGIDNPLQKGDNRTLQNIQTLTNQALATSGNYRKFRVDESTGEKYVHSINPLNGLPSRSKVLSASVKAPDCMTADAYATALMIMPFDRGKAMIEANPKLAAYWIVSKGRKVEEVFSSRWE
ncbi:MAG: FAD:protein FMN transferase [Flavobacteriaceae bacterium]